METEDEQIINDILKGEYMEEHKFQWTGAFTRTVNKVVLSENFTFRLDTREELEAERTHVIEKIMPSAETFPNDTGNVAHVATEKPAQTCPKCGAPLVQTTLKNGTVITKCSTNKWDKMAKKAIGCDYVLWPEKE